MRGIGTKVENYAPSHGEPQYYFRFPVHLEGDDFFILLSPLELSNCYQRAEYLKDLPAVSPLKLNRPVLPVPQWLRNFWKALVQIIKSNPLAP